MAAITLTSEQLWSFLRSCRGALDAATRDDTTAAFQHVIEARSVVGPEGVFAATILWAQQLNELTFGPVPPGVEYRVTAIGGDLDSDDVDPSDRLAARLLATTGNEEYDTAAALFLGVDPAVRLSATMRILEMLGRTMYAREQAATS